MGVLGGLGGLGGWLVGWLVAWVGWCGWVGGWKGDSGLQVSGVKTDTVCSLCDVNDMCVRKGFKHVREI